LATLWNARHAQTRLAVAAGFGFDPAQFLLSFRGAAEGREPGIHNPGAAEYGFRARSHSLASRNDTEMTVITDPLFYALAIPAVVALGLSKGGFAGVGQMAVPLLALIMPPLEAAAIFLPIMIVQDWTAVWVYRKDWNGRILAIMVPGAIIGVVGAGWLAAYISDAAVRVFIGVTTIIFVIYSFASMMRVARPASTGSVPAGVFWGAMSGFTSTICQAGGPPYQMYVLSQKLPKMRYVGTTAMFFAVLNALKVAPYLALGQFSTKGFGTSLVLLPLALLTNQLGFWLVRRTSQELFYKITLGLMLVISIELAREGIIELMRQ
jgi:hypothetical protein